MDGHCRGRIIRRVNRPVVAAGLLCVLAWASGAANIDRVEFVAQAVEPAGVGLAPPQMPKFVQDRPGHAKARYVVRWNAGAGVPAGALVTFEYRQDAADRIRFLSWKCEAALKGAQVTEFEIPGGGRAEAWRVRVVYGGRRLAETASDSWR